MTPVDKGGEPMQELRDEIKWWRMSHYDRINERHCIVYVTGSCFDVALAKAREINPLICGGYRVDRKESKDAITRDVVVTTR
jgi:hypothetical protein